ncbi:MAG: T9SS type A sorting domain-containing protein [Paludibacter sp.]|nr:T9SS type A sorting domain-containing protein [Paludibacter sp.]
MKKKLFTLGLAIASILSASAVVVITPDTGVNTDAIQKAVDANPTETVFELQRNGVYIMDKQYIFTRAITLNAQSGTGAMPIVDVVTDQTGAKPSQVFEFQNNLTLNGIYFNGNTRGGGIVSHMFRGIAANLTVNISNCYFDFQEQTVVRLDNSGCSVTFNNTIFRNISQLANIDNGRIVDGRGNAENTFIYQNCTFYNITGQPYRYSGTTSVINQIKVDHCTFYNSGYRMCLDEALNGIYTNNIMANCHWKANFSADNGVTPPAVVTGVIYIDSLKTAADPTRSFTVTNNNIYDTPSMTAAYAANQIKVVKRPFTAANDPWLANNQLTIGNNIAEVLTFSNAPAMPIGFISAYFAASGLSSFNTTANQNFYAEEQTGIDAPDVTTPFSFAYPGTALSATASTTGGPLGDPRWAPATSTGLNDVTSVVKINVFPNPVVDFMNLTFGENASVKVNIYDMQGRTVHFDRDFRNVNSGETIQIDLQSLSSGVYLYSIQAMVNGSLKLYNGKITK